MTTHDLYEERVNEEVGKLQTLEPGSEEHKKVVSDLAMLTDRLIRLKEVDIESKKMRIEKTKINNDAEKVAIEKEKLELEKEKLALEQLKIEANSVQADLEQKRIGIENQKVIDEQKDRKIKNLLSALGIIIPTGVTLAGMVLMFLFEENGTIASGAGRKIVDRIFRQK